MNGMLKTAWRSTLSRRCKSSYVEDAEGIFSEKYQYMQNSVLPTMYFQRSLPRLPIPKLEKTCERFLAAAHPILNAHDYQQAQHEVLKLKDGDLGNQLQQLLIEHDAKHKHTSYISEPWFEMYLSDRAPLPLNCNPLLVMKNETRAEYNDQVVRATNLIIASLRFWRSLQADLLEPEVYHMNSKRSDTSQFRRVVSLIPPLATYVAYMFKAYPLDMSQYSKLFGMSRIPELGKDRLVQNEDSRHILLMRRGNMYAVEVLDANGLIEAPETIYGRLKAVIALDEQREPAKVPLGVLTSCDRDTWAKARTNLLQSQHNARTIQQEVDFALFCLCLDTDENPVYDEQNPVPLFKNMLAGNAINRWFDKSLSLLLSADGTAAVNFEHSWGDGVAVLRYFNEIYKETLNSPHVSLNTIIQSHSKHDPVVVRPLVFEVDSSVQQAVEQAHQKHKQNVERLNMDMLRFAKLGKDTCKRANLSADAVMQLAFQLAYRRAFSDYVGTYESCSTAAFRHGRTETIRPCTDATKEFCEAMLISESKRASQNYLFQLIVNSSEQHSKLTREAAMGQGFDRHLFALKFMANKNNMSMPEIFDSEAYKRLNYNIISTSTLSSSALLAGSFGPVVPDGLGVGYSIQNEECGAIVTSYDKMRDGKSFIDSLEHAFKDLNDIITSKKN